MSASEVRAGRAFVEIYAKDSSVSGDLDRVAAKFKVWGEKMQKVGTAIFEIGAAASGALTGAAVEFGMIGSAMAEMSARTGVSVEALSGLRFAASQVGVSSEALESSIKRMNVSVLNFSRGGKEATEDFTALELKLQDLEGLTPDQQLRKISDALANIHDPGRQAALAVKVLGRNATDVLPLLENGSNTIDKFVDRAKRLGLIMSSDDAQAAEKLMQSFRELWDVVKMATFQIGAAMAPALMKNVTSLTGAIVGAANFIKTHRELIVTISKVAVGVMAAGATIAGLGWALSSVGTLVGVFAPLAVGAATFLGPLLLIGAATLAIGVYFTSAHRSISATLSTIGGEARSAASSIGTSFFNVWKYVRDVFTGILTDATEAFDGIKDALSGGDFRLAAQILWTTVQLEWVKGVAELRRLWAPIGTWLGTTWNAALYGVLEVWNTAIERIKVAWSKGKAFLHAEWVRLGASLKSVLVNVMAYLRGVMVDTFAFFATKLNSLIYAAKSLAMHITAPFAPASVWKQLDADKKKDQAAIDADQTAGHTKILNEQSVDLAGIEEAKQKELDEIAARRRDEITAARAELASVLKRLAEEHKAADAKAASNDTSAIAELEKRRGELQRQLDDLVKRASDKALKSPPGLPLPTGKPPIDDGPIKDLMKGTAMGTFNVTKQFALSAGGGNVNTKHLAKIEEHTANMARHMDRLKGGPRPMNYK